MPVAVLFVGHKYGWKEGRGSRTLMGKEGGGKSSSLQTGSHFGQ